jgi:hypothetical protein
MKRNQGKYSQLSLSVLGVGLLLVGILIGFVASSVRNGERDESVAGLVAPTPVSTPGPVETETPAPLSPTVTASPTVAVQAAVGGHHTAPGTFEGSPLEPVSYNSGGFMAGWDVTIDGSENGDQSMSSATAHHGADCSPAPGSHHVSNFDAAVFQCRDHFMTVGEGGEGKYTIISVTPPFLLDFSAGEACASVDISTWRSSDRDWWELWLTPFADNLTEPHQDWLPAANGEPRNAVMVRLEGADSLIAFSVKNFDATEVARASFRQFIGEPSATKRLQHSFCMSKTGLTFSIDGKKALEARLAIAGWDRAVFQMQHSTYNPDKGACVQACGVNTWHWDNVKISPSVPFYIDRATPRYGTEFSLSQPTPAGSYLRFSGLGSWQFSANGGESWAPVARQAMEDDRPEHGQTFWQPIPEGVTRILLRGRSDGAGLLARDVHVWSLTTVSP